MRPILRVAFAGGCHVAGFPVGEERGFAQGALQTVCDQFQVETQSYAHLPLTRPERLVLPCTRFGPHVLILQLGNYESYPRMFPRMRKLLRRVQSTGSSGPNWVPRPHLRFQPTAAWRIKMGLKQSLDTAFRHSFVDLSLHQQRLMTYLEAVAQIGIPYVLVLSPLPCADPTVLHYRHRLAALFAAACRQFGFHYLDVLGPLGAGTGSPLDYSVFADALHLSVEGHRRLGATVADMLQSLVLKNEAGVNDHE